MENRASFPWFSAALVMGIIAVACFMVYQRSAKGADNPVELSVPIIETPQVETPTEPPSITKPVTQEPAPVAVAEAPAPQILPKLPPLNKSDASFKQSVAELNGGAALLALLVNDELIRKGVRMVHGLSEGFVVKEFRPVHSPEGRFEVRKTGEHTAEGAPYYRVSETNAARYARYVHVLKQIDPMQAYQLYKQYAPLMQSAYEELGLRERSFDKVMVKAIDNLIQQPVGSGDARLRQPAVMYIYDDTQTETSSGVNKLKLRLGRDAYIDLAQWLAQFKAALESKT